ncbi:MAG: hypothetical protein R2783_08970 [Gelidibacter sp.]
MRNRFLKTALVLSAFILTLACSTDDHTGDSTQTPSNPSLSVTLGFANTQTLIEQEASFPFTVSISEPQIVSVVVYLTQTGGTADSDDFSIPASVTIPAGATSASGTIDIHADDLVEDTETAVIQIATGFESNVQVSNSQTVTFNIANLVEGDLEIGLLWNTNVFAIDGSEFSPTDLADLRLLITDVPYTTVLDGSDGSGFESYTLTSDTPDGEYYVVADWYAAYNLGAQGSFPVDLTATFDQVGVINGMTLDFANALNSGNSCSSVYYILAKITKTGQNYDISSVGENSPVVASSFVGTATVVVDDWADYAVGASIPIEAGSNPNEFYIRNYNNPAVANPNTSYMIVTIDPLTGDVTVTSNEAFDYGCSDGAVSGSGSVNACAGTIDLVLDFDLGNCGVYDGNVFSLQL